MRVLWVCNLILPAIAEQLGLEASNKEGWVAGLADQILKDQKQSGLELGIAFPAPSHLLPKDETFFEREFTIGDGKVTGFGFRENVDAPQIYDPSLEAEMSGILRSFQPQVIHCFGTEYPHTLAICKVCEPKERLLITLQGLCTEIAKAYEADLPKNVVNRKTFRDWIKKDGILDQKEKFRLRGNSEREAVGLSANIGGRTPWDQKHAMEWNPAANYFVLQETLRRTFYEGDRWERESCEKYSIFLSQGDYPLKGLHYMLLALPKVLEQYPDAKVKVAGNSLVSYCTLKEKLKISSYGKYLRELMEREKIADRVTFLGKLSSEEMKKTYLQSGLFVCPSAVENSPNSLGEAMLLGMPCVAADVGGIPGIFTDGVDGISYRGFSVKEHSDDAGAMSGAEAAAATAVAQNLANAILDMWSDPVRESEYCESARAHALRNHDGETNYRQLLAVYARIAEGGSEGKENGE
ncbi:MAG: glycosyltransferase family 4 protein [Acetatifactor sp.]|nr:glycosyltransferase family 4 protein [Acetatifactor sp.]